MIELWTDRLETALSGYSADLLRQIAARLLKTRNQWPSDELIERIRDANSNAPVIDRRLKDITPAARAALALIGLSRRPDWKAGHLLTMLHALGHADGTAPIQVLFEEGLIYPLRPSGSPRLQNFTHWLSTETGSGLRFFAHPAVTSRAKGEDLGLPILQALVPARAEIRETDGLEWPLRLAVAWQQTAGSPLRRTMQQDFFKRDLQRLRTDPLLNASFAESVADVPDAGLLAVIWAAHADLLHEDDTELHSAAFPAAWALGLFPTIAHLWQTLPEIEAWDPAIGWEPVREASNPFPSIYLPALLLLARQPADAWVRLSDICQWLETHHPYFSGRPGPSGWCAAMVGGLFFQLRLVQFAPGGDDWLTRLSPHGRRLLGPDRAEPETAPFPHTLIVQPNFELLAFRQGLTPDLIANLTKFAQWKSLGTACMLELVAEQVYRGLETGLSFDAIQRLLRQHSARPLPENVADALRTWANKRERIVVYNGAVLVEFATPADLDAAAARGLIETRLTDRIGLVSDENALDYRQFRLTGTRDYGAKAEKCVNVGEDGVTLRVDAGRADLLLDTELVRVAEPARPSGDARVFRLTRESLQKALKSGLSFQDIDDWLATRSGFGLSAAAKLLAAAEAATEFRLERNLVLYAPTAEAADGLTQLPATRDLIRARLGPTAMLVADDDVAALQEQIRQLSQVVEGP
jgi:hypothetical protein